MLCPKIRVRYIVSPLNLAQMEFRASIVGPTQDQSNGVQVLNLLVLCDSRLLNNCVEVHPLVD